MEAMAVVMVEEAVAVVMLSSRTAMEAVAVGHSGMLRKLKLAASWHWNVAQIEFVVETMRSTSNHRLSEAMEAVAVLTQRMELTPKDHRVS